MQLNLDLHQQCQVFYILFFISEDFFFPSARLLLSAFTEIIFYGMIHGETFALLAICDMRISYDQQAL